MALPTFVKAYVNRQLNKLEEYGGSLEGVDLAIWRGAYVIHDLRIFKKGDGVPVPFIHLPRLDLSIQWRELFRGAIVGEISVDRPALNFVSGPTEAESQSGKNQDWQKSLGHLLPIRLNLLTIAGGEIHFRDFHNEPPIDIFVRDLSVVATNLTNSRDLDQSLPSGVVAHGRTIGDGEISVMLRLDAMARSPTFKLEATLTNLNLIDLNDFLRAYGKFDVERGTAAIFTEVAAADGRFEGYVKPLFENIDVFSWQKEKRKSVLQVFWQAIVGTASTVFKNQPKDRLATIVPISGDYGGTETDITSAVGALLRNAFVRALVPRIDHTVEFDEVEQSASNE